VIESWLLVSENRVTRPAGTTPIQGKRGFYGFRNKREGCVNSATHDHLKRKNFGGEKKSLGRSGVISNLQKRPRPTRGKYTKGGTECACPQSLGRLYGPFNRGPKTACIIQRIN